MTVEPLPALPTTSGAFVPDLPAGAVATAVRGPEDGIAGFGGELARALDGACAALVRADAAERAFASGRGGLHEMVLERAQADVALSLATAAASRATQALSTILGMQI